MLNRVILILIIMILALCSLIFFLVSSYISLKIINYIICVLLIISSLYLVFIMYSVKTKRYINHTVSFLKVFFPLLLIINKIFQKESENISNLFVELNNHSSLQSIKENNKAYRSEEILLLLPHCIQNSKCTHKITLNIKNCKKCGRCLISELIELSERERIKISIVPGGGAARRVIKSINPKIIVAIACNRDLISGIIDIKKPVIGIKNIIYKDFCVDTGVDIKEIEKIIKTIRQKMTIPGLKSK